MGRQQTAVADAGSRLGDGSSDTSPLLRKLIDQRPAGRYAIELSQGYRVDRRPRCLNISR